MDSKPVILPGVSFSKFSEISALLYSQTIKVSLIKYYFAYDFYTLCISIRETFVGSSSSYYIQLIKFADLYITEKEKVLPNDVNL